MEDCGIDSTFSGHTESVISLPKINLFAHSKCTFKQFKVIKKCGCDRMHLLTDTMTLFMHIFEEIIP